MVDSFCDSFYIPAEVHPTAPGRDKTITQSPIGKVDMGLLDFIKTADPRKVWAVEVQKGDDQVKLLESTQHCFMPLVIPAAGGSSSALAAKIPALNEGGQEDVAEEDAYLELADPDEGTAMVRQSEDKVVTEQSKKVKKRRLQKQSDVLPAKKLRTDHPALAFGAGCSSALAVPVGFTAADPQLQPGVACDYLIAMDVNSEHSGPSLSMRKILKLKSKLAKKEAEAAEVIGLHDQVSTLSEEKSALTVEVSALRITVTQKDHDISLLNSRATSLASTLDNAKVSSLRADFQDFKEGLEVSAHGGTAAQELYIRVAELIGTVMRARWVMLWGQAVDLVWQGRLRSRAMSMGLQRRLPFGKLLKSKKDAGMDEVLDCFLLDGPLVVLPEAAYLQPCIEQLSVPIHHAGDTTAVGETSMSFSLMNVHARAEGAKKHVADLRQLMMDIVSAPLSSQTWVGKASTSVAPLSVEDYDEKDTDEALGSVVSVPKFETCRF
ncbi:hypothetical protein Tco_1385204 [Tanacetum coccineum]